MKTKNKCGAPLKNAKLKHSERLWVTQLTPSQLDVYTQAAKDEGVSKSEWVRNALNLRAGIST